MKISIFTQYGSLNSGPVFQAFKQGAEKLGFSVIENSIDADVFVIWSVLWQGRMKPNQEIWNLAKKLGKKLIILEVGGLIRGTTWRIGLNHVNNLGKFYKENDYDSNRPEKLGIKLLPRKINGKNILICGQHSKSEQWVNRPDPIIWLTDLIKSIRKYSTRKIIFRPHPRDYNWVNFLPKLDIDIKIPTKIDGTYDDFNHEDDFKNAWIVINPSSNTGIQAAIAGIPVFTENDSLAYPISNKNLELIENPILPDRSQWLIAMTHCEWLEHEIKNGTPLAKMLDFL